MDTKDQLINKTLRRIYQPEHIFLQRVSRYSPREMLLECFFLVPRCETTRYTVEELTYVSSTQRHSCVNQLAYGLTALLISDQVGEFGNLSLDDFVGLSRGFQMWNTLEHFEHRLVIPRDEEFTIAMRVSRARIARQNESRQNTLGIVQSDIFGGVSGCIKFAVTFPPP